MSPLSPPLAVRPRENQFVGDLANLLRRYRVHTDSPEFPGALTSLLQVNSSFRSDLLMLCSAISRMAEAELAPEELLQLLAKAGCGAQVGSGILIPDELKREFVIAWQEWQARSESLSASFWDDPMAGSGIRSSRVIHLATMQGRRSSVRTTAVTGHNPSTVSSNTRIGELTISQLRTYLDDIEERVGRLQPYLDAFSEGSPDLAGASEATERVGVDSFVAIEASASCMSLTQPSGESGLRPAMPGAALPEVDVHHAEIVVRPSLQDLPSRKEVDSPETGTPALFRSITDAQTGWSHALIWAAAAVVSMAPAAYYARTYLYPAPASMPVSAPQPPAYFPQERVAPAGKIVGPTNPAPVLRTQARSTPHLLPKEVRMEARAAQAEQP